MASETTQAGPDTRLVISGGGGGVRNQAIPIKGLFVGYGVAGCDRDGTVVIHGLRHGKLGQAMPTDVHGYGAHPAEGSMAWSPSGGVWLAIVRVVAAAAPAAAERSMDVAMLEVLDGRTGQTVFRHELVRAGEVEVVCVRWASSGQALIVGLGLDAKEFAKSMVWFQDPAIRDE